MTLIIGLPSFGRIILSSSSLLGSLFNRADGVFVVHYRSRLIAYNIQQHTLDHSIDDDVCSSYLHERFRPNGKVTVRGQ
jgi:hypothetical protein